MVKFLKKLTRNRIRRRESADSGRAHRTREELKFKKIQTHFFSFCGDKFGTKFELNCCCFDILLYYSIRQLAILCIIKFKVTLISPCKSCYATQRISSDLHSRHAPTCANGNVLTANGTIYLYILGRWSRKNVLSSMRRQREEWRT